MSLEAIIAAALAGTHETPAVFDFSPFTDDAALAALRSEIITAGLALPATDVPGKQAHVAAARAIDAERQGRSAAAAAAQAALDADAELTALTASDDPAEPEAPVEPEAPAEEAPADAETPAEPAETVDVTASTTSSTPTTEEPAMPTINEDRVATLEAQVATLITAQEAHTAAADEARRTAALSTGDAPGQAAPTDAPVVRRASITVLPEQGNDAIETADVRALASRIRQVAESTRGFNTNKVIATVPVFEPGTEMLMPGAAARNTELLFDGTLSRRAARTAAACDCGPLARRLDLPICFSMGTPLEDAFTNRWPIETMSYEFFRAQNLSDFEGGVQVWTCEDQDAIDPSDPDTWKACATLDCDTEKITETAFAIWSCLLIDEFQNWSILPIAENRIAALAAQTARMSEAKIQAKLRALSVKYAAIAPLGASPGLFEVLDAAVNGVEWNDRLADVMWTPVIPRGMARLINTDERNKAYGDPDLRALSAKFNEAGYASPVVVMDDFAGAVLPQWHPTGAVAEGARISLPTFHAQAPVFRLYLVDFNSVHLAKRPVYTMREVRDLDRYRQNQYAIVQETAYAVGRHGCIPPISIDVALCPSGTRAELTEYDCTDTTYGTPTS